VMTEDCFAIAPMPDERDRIIQQQAAELAELREHCRQLSGDKFSDRNHAALKSRAETAERRCAELVAKAQAVVDRWDTPLWKDVPATAVFINELRTTLTGDDRHAG
jgi:hypothetical protein